jgi:iron complex transport system ATP-binding protein
MMLTAHKLTLEVPGRVLCRELEVSFGPGEVWVVLGRNGTGKSTLIHVLGGLAKPARGHVALDGELVPGIEAKSRAQRLGVLLQIEEGVYWGTVEEYVLLGRFPHVRGWGGYAREDRDIARAALGALGMTSYAMRRYASLSGGERQRVRIAQVLAQRPTVLLMDEPLQHLDLAHQAHVLALIAARAKKHEETAVMVMHEPLWIGHGCTHALLFDGDGAVAAGRAEDMLTREQLEQAYGCALTEVTHATGRCFVPHV